MSLNWNFFHSKQKVKNDMHCNISLYVRACKMKKPLPEHWKYTNSIDYHDTLGIRRKYLYILPISITSTNSVSLVKWQGYWNCIIISSVSLYYTAIHYCTHNKTSYFKTRLQQFFHTVCFTQRIISETLKLYLFLTTAPLLALNLPYSTLFFLEATVV